MPFKEEFPQFESILLYDFKNTSVTKAFQIHSPYEIQELAGHAKVATTTIYDEGVHRQIRKLPRPRGLFHRNRH